MPSVSPSVFPASVSAIAGFGRYLDEHGRTMDIEIGPGSDFGKAADPHSAFHHIGDLVARLDRRLAAPGSRPVAYVGVGLGPALAHRTGLAWQKEDFDESKHSRVPGGCSAGGRFCSSDRPPVDSAESPKAQTREALESRVLDAATQAHVMQGLQQRLERLAARRVARARLVALARLIAGVAVDVVPGVGEAVDAALIMETVADFEELHAITRAALAFVRSGPHALEELEVSSEMEGFATPEAFVKVSIEREELEKRFGPAGEGYDYHHIVWKGGANARNIPPELMNSTENMIRVPRLLHEAINEEYAKPFGKTGLTVRQWCDLQPYEVQRAKGLEIMRELGIIQ